MPYRAPVEEFNFLFSHVVKLEDVVATDRFADATPDMVTAILNEAGRMCEEVLAPLQRNGDLHPAKLENGVVRTSPGFDEGYKAIAEGGWVSISASQDNGGMGLPMAVTTAVNEMMSGACLSLQLNPLMTQGQIEALEHHASDAVKELYLPKLISGEWTGTMNLTEPQAGSDVGALSSRAEDNGDGTYAVSGQKIYISWGDNDFAGNVCHLVLARLPGAPAGTKGISLFLVPKFLPDENGNPGQRNGVSVVSLEHKMGLHGSPTAVMQYDNATGWLVGPEGGGMAAMFTMMNNARLGVGAQGIGAAEGAYQLALDYALDRKQGRSPVEGGTGTIVDHADVRRMLMTMKADIFAARAIALSCAYASDMARAGQGEEWAARFAFLTPITKAFGTDTGIAISNMGVQVHGGMGFVEETGAAQFSRDVRVTAIYEGTNGIQAMDLVGRKLSLKGGQLVRTLFGTLSGYLKDNPEAPHREELKNAMKALETATMWLASNAPKDPEQAGAAATPYLRLMALTVIGYLWSRMANVANEQLAAGEGNKPLLESKVVSARFYFERLLPEVDWLLGDIQSGKDSLMAFSDDHWAA